MLGRGWQRVPGHDSFEEQVQRAMDGLFTVTLQPAMNSVDADRVARRAGAKDLAGLRELDLEELDRVSWRTRMFYTTAAFTEGGATALAVTGAEVSATVSGGTTLVVAASAVAVDVASSIALLGRIVARVGAQYGYDVRLPDEEVFAMGVISLGSAGAPTVKVSALTALSRLSQQMMRQGTWRQLSKNQMVKLVDLMYRALGYRLTKAKLAQTVPVVGVLLNGGVSADMADRTHRRALDIYRLRFLSDKYGIEPTSWLIEAEDPLPPDDVLDVALDELASEAGAVDPETSTPPHE